jgi:lysozyme
MTPTAHFPDISHFEPVEDFHAIAAGGCPLVITKATEGCGYNDPTYASFADRIRSVPGLILGAYVFEDPGPAIAQVAHYLSVAHLQPGDLQPIVDAEKLGLTCQETYDALENLEARGYRPILYCSLAFFTDVLHSPRPWWLWLAAYRANLPILPLGVRLFAWQHTDCGDCPGVGQPCDMSYLYIAPTDLQNFCIA